MGQLLEQREAAQKHVWNCERAVRAIEAHLNASERKLATAERHGYNTVQIHRDHVTDLQASLAGAQQSLEAARLTYHDNYTALQQTRQERRLARHAAICATLHIPTHIRVQVDWNEWDAYYSSSRWELQEMERDEQGQPVIKEGTGREGQPYRYQERRFGYSATVYGPRRDLHTDGWDQGGSQVSWGTLGSLIVPDARDMLSLLQLATDLAAYLNEVRDTWYAEDMAD